MASTVLEPPVTETVVPAGSRASRDTCLTCPVCGSEECSVLQELGMYCDTKTAASIRRLGRPEPANELWATYGVG